MLLKVFYKARRIKSSRSSWAFIKAALFILMALILAGCVPALFRSAKGPDETASVRKPGETLIKPKLVQKPRTPEQSETDTSQIAQDGPYGNKKNYGNGRTESTSLDMSEDKNNQSLIKSNPKDSNDKEKVPRQLTGVEKGQVPPESEQIRGDKPSDVKIKNTDNEDWLISDERKPSFKKHDHSKYVNRIKNLAINILNSQSSPFYATLCCDSTTDEWSFTIYFKQSNNFRYNSFIWDPIDDKWEQQYESESKPLTGWKKHVSFVSSGKQCSLLKGGGSN